MHCYDISSHPERISNLKSYENKYNFIHITLTEFEINNPNIPLKIFNEDSEEIYTSKNDTSKKAYIVQLKSNRHAAMKPHKNKFIQLNKTLKSFSHIELKEYVLNLIN